MWIVWTIISGAVGGIVGIFVGALMQLVVSLICALAGVSDAREEQYAVAVFFGSMLICIFLAAYLPVEFHMQEVSEKRAADEAANQRALIESRKREEAAEQHRQQQEERRRKQLAELDLLVNDSSRLAGQLPGLIRRAENALDVAERELAGGYFDPFWDAIESSATALATYSNGVRTLAANSSTHRRRSQELGEAGQLNLAHYKVPSPRLALDRMASIIRQSQRHADFTMIFHVRRTNKILVAGFTTLGEALGNLRNELVSAIGDVERCVSVSTTDLLKGIDDQASGGRERLDAIIAYHAEIQEILVGIAKLPRA